MLKMKKGIKIIDINKIEPQNNIQICKFIRGFLDENYSGSIVIEINEHNDNELICNVTTKKGNNFTVLETELQPILNSKNIHSRELLRFNMEIATVKGVDRVIVSEKRKIDSEELENYCSEKNIDIDDLFAFIISSKELE